MANPNPWRARLKRWEKQYPVPIATIQAQAYGVLQLAYEDVAVDDPEARRKAVLCYFQALTSLSKLYQSGELEARIASLEAERVTRGHLWP